jgi:hypothetical protein
LVVWVGTRRNEVILACLAKDLDHRPQSADELSQRLAACETISPWTSGRVQEWWDLNRPPV